MVHFGRSAFDQEAGKPHDLGEGGVTRTQSTSDAVGRNYLLPGRSLQLGKLWRQKVLDLAHDKRESVPRHKADIPPKLPQKAQKGAQSFITCRVSYSRGLGRLGQDDVEQSQLELVQLVLPRRRLPRSQITSATHGQGVTQPRYLALQVVVALALGQGRELGRQLDGDLGHVLDTRVLVSSAKTQRAASHLVQAVLLVDPVKAKQA